MRNAVTTDRLEQATRDRELLELDWAGRRLAFLPLWPTTPGDGAGQGWTGKASIDGWAGVSFRVAGDVKSFGIECINPAVHDLVGHTSPRCVPDPAPMPGRQTKLSIAEIMAAAARLGVAIAVRYDTRAHRDGVLVSGEVLVRDLRDVKIKPPGAIAAFDLVRNEPRTFRLDKITAVEWADLTWTREAGWQPHEQHTGRAARLTLGRR